MRNKASVVVLCVLLFASFSWAFVEHEKLVKMPPVLTQEEKDERVFMVDQLGVIQGQINMIQTHALELKKKVEKEHPGFQFDLQSGNLIPIPEPAPAPVKK